MHASNIVHLFNQLMAQLSAFAVHIDRTLSAYPMWIWQGQELVGNRELIKEAFTTLSYEEGECGQSTLSCPGALAGTEQTLAWIESINALKDRLQQEAAQYLRACHRPDDTKLLRDILAQAGFPMIKLRQVYRRIQVVHFHPRRISFTLTKHNSHCIISRLEAEERLAQVGQGANIEWQRQQLALIDDTHLVVRHDIKPIWAVNVSTFKNEVGRSKTTKILTRLPIVYLHDPEQPLPRVGLSRPYQRHQKEHLNKSIEATPFLPSIAAYRYKR